MSYYGNKTFRGRYFSILKTLVSIGEQDRFKSGKPTYAYKTSDGSLVDLTLHDSGVYFVEPTDSDVVVVRILNINPEAESTFENIEFVDVVGAYNLPAGKSAVVLEGTIACGDLTFDANIDLGLIVGDENEKALTGTGKVLALNFTY